MCTVENSSHFHPEEVVEFYRGSEDVIGMAQWDKCFQVFSQYPLKYDGICDKGTNRRSSSVKKYILRIHKVSTMDQRDWHCQLKVAEGGTGYSLYSASRSYWLYIWRQNQNYRYKPFYLFLTPNSRSVVVCLFCAGVSLNIHSFIHLQKQVSYLSCQYFLVCF